VRTLFSVKSLFRSFLILIAPAASALASGGYACRMDAMSVEERATHAALMEAMLAAVQERQELPDGIAFRLPPDQLPTIAQWVELERKCCPFFTFEIEVPADGQPLWLRLTGPEGIKEFIVAELRLDAQD